MRGQFILLSGSASRSCPDDKLDQAMQFVEGLVQHALQAGGGVVVLLGNEDSAKGEDGKPRIFDWVILRAIESYAASTLGAPRTYARVIMSDDAWNRKMGQVNRQTLTNLQQRGVVEIKRIRRETYTGGTYRKAACELADVLIAAGGGKGTYLAGQDMLAMGKPVLPLDLDIGSFSEDGEGALALHREFLTDFTRFLPRTHSSIASRIETISFNGGGCDVARISRSVVELLTNELAGDSASRRHGFVSLFARLWAGIEKLLTVIGVFRAVEFLRNLFLIG